MKVARCFTASATRLKKPPKMCFKKRRCFFAWGIGLMLMPAMVNTQCVGARLHEHVEASPLVQAPSSPPSACAMSCSQLCGSRRDENEEINSHPTKLPGPTTAERRDAEDGVHRGALVIVEGPALQAVAAGSAFVSLPARMAKWSDKSLLEGNGTEFEHGGGAEVRNAETGFVSG